MKIESGNKNHLKKKIGWLKEECEDPDGCLFL